MELLVMIDALSRASAGRVTAVIPYYGYARQDRKDQPRVPITAKLVADMLTIAGVDRVLSMDLHSGQVQGFFNIPVDHLTAVPIFLDYFREKKIDNIVVVSPDVGGVKRARNFAVEMDANVAVVAKRRMGDDETQVDEVIGEVKGKQAIIIDDQISGGGTMVRAAEALKQIDKKMKVYAVATHPVFVGQAVERLAEAPIDEVIVTDTIPIPRAVNLKKLTVLSVANELASAIDCIHKNTSVSSLFRGALF